MTDKQPDVRVQLKTLLRQLTPRELQWVRMTLIPAIQTDSRGIKITPKEEK